MKVLILEDVIEHQVRLERILDEISKESNIPISYKTTGKVREFEEYIENEDVVDYFDYNYKGNDLKIPYHDILYIETTGVSHKLRIIGKNFAKEFYGTMTDIQEKDKHTQRFYSPHKSFLVNIGNIREIDRKNLEIVFYEDHRCPISRLKIRKLKDILEKKSQK